MPLFDSFTGPRWQHQNPEVRKNAVEQLDDPDVLVQLVRDDPDPAVQSMALARIDNPETLDALIESLPQTLQQQARNQRLQQILPSAEGLAAIEDDVTLERIVSLSDDVELTAAAIERISSDVVRLQIANSHAVAKVRLKAALGIEDMELLSELMQCSRGRDKTVFRHCKTRLDEHSARQLAAAERQEKIRQLCEQVRQLAAAADTPEFESNYRVLLARWRLVKSSASRQQLEHFEHHQASCAQRLVRLADARAGAQQVKADRAAASRVYPAIIAELKQLDAEHSPFQEEADIMQLAASLDDIENRWLAVQKVTPATKEQTQTCRRYLEQWRSVLLTLQRLHARALQLNKILADAESTDPADYQALQRLIKRVQKMAATLPWPESHHARMPPLMARLHEVMTRLQSEFSALQEDQPRHIARMEKRLARLRSELDQNHSKEADRALLKATRILKSLAPRQRRQFEQEIQPLAVRVREVDDWRNFAVEPKKVELCARMSDLIGSEEDVEVLAAKIACLQDEWKQLGALPHARDQALWNEFKAAADEAWKPCKAAFAKQASMRRENYARRMELVEQLKEYEEKMAWPEPEAEAVPAENPAPDWRLVQKTLDTARAAFRRLKPVDQKSDRISYKAFRTICDRIYAHIKQEYERNITRKKHLAAQAQELATTEDLPQAIEKCKKLQQEWKEVGITPVAVDRKLWKTFRASCDAVFARMDEQRAQHSAEIEARIKQAESLRDQARALLSCEDEEQGLQLNHALSKLKRQLREIDLPAGVNQRLAKDFQVMEKRARDIGLEIRRRREQAAWSQVLEKMAACALQTTDEAAATAKWQTAGDLPAGIDEAALEAFWRQGPSDDLEEQQREACIALEVLAGIESPVEDKKARMNYQLQRLAAGMGRNSDQAEPSLEERISAFIALRPPASWQQRFCSTLEKIRG